jgi:CheY-like chemotaxis protein
MVHRTIDSHCRECFEACNGLEAVNIIADDVKAGGSHQYDVIMLDYQMPQMDGPEAAEKIRLLGFTGKIFGLTGNASQDQIDDFIAHGADRVFVKPFAVAEVLQALLSFRD